MSFLFNCKANPFEPTERFPLSAPVADLSSRGGLRAGDQVLCRIRRCPSNAREGNGFMEPFIEEIEGSLSRVCFSGPFWWVDTKDGIRLVYIDELEKKP